MLRADDYGGMYVFLTWGCVHHGQCVDFPTDAAAAARAGDDDNDDGAWAGAWLCFVDGAVYLPPPLD